MIRAMLDYVEAANSATDTMNRLKATLSCLNEVARRVNAHAIRYNHGKARKVSFRRPSPQMSRKRLDDLWTKEYLAEPECERKVLE